jgi:heme-degrading monooxygenase HmoA
MVYEIAVLPVPVERTKAFQEAFAKVLHLLRRAEGYQGHVLAQGVESPSLFNLIVKWRSLEDHAPGFETSEDHEIFMNGIADFFSEEPQVYHLEGGAFASGNDDLSTSV